MFLKIPNLRYLLILCLINFTQNSLFADNKPTPKVEVKIGILAYHGDQRTKERWQPTINYLNTQFATYSFRLIPLSLPEVGKAIRDNRLDFVITNTGNYIQLEHRYGISRMATLINKQLNRSSTVFGAVIFTRADRDDINSINDIKNKSLVAVNEDGFGGFQITWAELKKNQFDPYSDLSKLSFTGFPQSQVIQRVLNREADVGTFRTDSIEQLVKLGAIDLSKIKIINQKQNKDFPFIHSTTLYPEWPFSKLKQTSNELSHQVAIALLSIKNNSLAANASNSAGWTIPLDYKPANDLMKELHVGPYFYLDKVSFTSVIKNYWQLITLAGILFLVVLLFAFIFFRLNKQLSKTNTNLEDRIIESSKLTIELKHQATHDSLTNIYNRYAFNTFLDKELQRCIRNKTQLAVIIIDLDDFKLINDEHGHLVGDEFLKEFSLRINTALRDSDINARIGGDEFAILCLDIIGDSDLKKLTSRILKITETEYYLNGLEKSITNTNFSLGVAIYPANGNTAELLLRHADFQMYKMKKCKTECVPYQSEKV